MSPCVFASWVKPGITALMAWESCDYSITNYTYLCGFFGALFEYPDARNREALGSWSIYEKGVP